MEIKNNDELVKAVNDAISESGYKKSYIADKLEISRQGLSNLLAKQNFSLDDANKILSVIGYETLTKVNKKD